VDKAMIDFISLNDIALNNDHNKVTQGKIEEIKVNNEK
jgi:hypothetical protein